ncbi:FkbM family methyltransferase [Adhaeribacter rhizoryzae]|nr:FkbM family methyltransferase [Adhaeribacter rhizoryzae]
MIQNSIALRMNNSIAYRFNKFVVKKNRSFRLTLNKKNFNIPLLGLVGEVNISLNENWFNKLLLFWNLPEHSDFLDIGTNVGQTLITFKSCYENIIYWGFEPNPVCVSYLETLIKANNFSNTYILPIGLSSQSSVVKFYSNSSQHTGASINNEFRPGFYAAAEIKYVPVFVFDELDLNINHISFIKIDVEGAELEVISGMVKTIQKHQPIIVCEVLDYHNENVQEYSQKRANQLMDCFKTLKYKAYRILHGQNIIRYEEINSIKLKQWTNLSYERNDYLFIPNHISSLPT